MKKQCKCYQCGKEFEIGQQGDNEELCLCCEHTLMTMEMDDHERELLDLELLKAERQ